MTESKLFDIRIDEPSAPIYSRAKERFDSLAKPVDGLGRFEDIICRIAAIRGSVMPDISNKCLVIMCSDNGVVDEGVSQTDRSVTAEVAALMGKNKSSVGAMTYVCPVKIFPVDIGIDCDERIEGVLDRKIARGTGNISKEPAMTSRQCLDAIQTGMDMAVSCACQGFDIIATGEMGIGNTTSASAIASVLLGRPVSEVTGRGAGLSGAGLRRKTETIRRGISLNRPDAGDPIDVLTKVGGLDLAALCGFYLGAAHRRRPVLLDGLITYAAALCAVRLCPKSGDAFLASHCSAEPASRLALDELGLSPLISAGLHLGEGSGAVAALPLLDMALRVYHSGNRFACIGIKPYQPL